MHRALATILIALIAPVASANYNANLSGIPTVVTAYDSGVVIFTLDTQPLTHPECNHAGFAIDPAIDPHAFNRMYAALLAAKTAGQPINVGYDNAGGCVSGFIHTYAIG